MRTAKETREQAKKCEKCSVVSPIEVIKAQIEAAMLLGEMGVKVKGSYGCDLAQQLVNLGYNVTILNECMYIDWSEEV